MPDPDPKAYEIYREGILSRHVLCSGRYVEKLWLKQDEVSDPIQYAMHHRRDARIPEICGNWGAPYTFVDGNEARSEDGPFLFATDDKLYLAWSGIGEHHRLQWTSTTNGVDWEAKHVIEGEKSHNTPALAFFN